MTQTVTDRVHDPIHRSAYAFRREGDTLWIDTWLQDGAHLPEHFHPSLEEHWEVLDGAAGSSSTARGGISSPPTAPSSSPAASATSCGTRAAARPTCAPR